jgi:hypothetical protein
MTELVTGQFYWVQPGFDPDEDNVADALGGRRNRPAEPLGSPSPGPIWWGMSNTVVRIFKREESFEVRVSTFFYFDDNPGRRAINKRMKSGRGSREGLREGPARRSAIYGGKR